MTDESSSPKNDLTSLANLPGFGSGGEATPDGAEEAIQFESLEELSKKEIPPTGEPTSEGVISGLDMSSLDTPSLPEGAAPSGKEFAAAPEEPQGATTEAEIPEFTAPPPQLTQAPVPPSIDSIKNYSDNLAASAAQVVAAFPFTLKIEGKLKPEEAEKLLTILERENMGISSVDLEPQIEEGKILIPRISEYAGVLLIQALRGVTAKIHFGPSDEIFSTPETREDVAAPGTAWSVQDMIAEVAQAHETADEVIVTNLATLPQYSHVEAIDTVVVSGLLSTPAVEAATSPQYTKLLEGLMRELKFKAKRRGANGIVSLTISLTPLTLPTDYRVTVTGTAVVGSA